MTDFKCGAVALVGRPNAGKSTLLNAFLGETLAIVTPKPQTTRTVMAGILTGDGFQAVFYDTPGMHVPRNELSGYMLKGIQDALDGSDLALFLLDATAGLGEEEQLASEWLKKSRRPVLMVLNKTDAVPYPRQLLLKQEAKSLGHWPLHAIQALTGQGVEALLEEVRKLLPEHPPLYPEDQSTATNLRDLAGELIREQCLLQLKQEIPHGVAVVVEEYKEDQEPLLVTATLHVERESHKGIVIGTGGKQLKAIGQAARESLERLVQRKVYLQLWVKVTRNWRKDAAKMKRLGYGPAGGG